MSKPYRLNGGGSRIDRSKRVTFSFDGKTLSGFAGRHAGLRGARPPASASSAAASSITARAASWGSAPKR